MRYHGRFESPKPEKKKKTKKKKQGRKVALIVLTVVLVVALCGFLVGKKILNDMIGKVTTVEVPKIQYTTAPVEESTASTESEEREPTTVETTVPHVASSEDYINILVVGQAARAGDEERFADTMILCTINKYEKTLTLTSILRDSVVHNSVTMFGKTFGGTKITTIYHMGSTYGDGVAGSMALMNQTLYNNFGIEVDYNVEIDFEAFVKAVDLLGGVTMTITQAEADYLNNPLEGLPQTFNAGEVHMWGEAALCYARMRKAEGDGDSDITRTARQRNLIQALLGQVKKMSLSDVQSIADNVLPLIITSMTSDEILDMIGLMLPMLPDLTLQSSGTCPVEGTYWGDMKDIYGDGNKHSVLCFEPYQQKKLMRAITEGEQ